MMMLAMKNDKDVQDALSKNKKAIHDNNEALASLLRCIYGVGETGEARIASLIKEVKGDGKNNPSGVQ